MATTTKTTTAHEDHAVMYEALAVRAAAEAATAKGRARRNLEAKAADYLRRAAAWRAL